MLIKVPSFLFFFLHLGAIFVKGNMMQNCLFSRYTLDSNPWVFQIELEVNFEIKKKKGSGEDEE